MRINELHLSENNWTKIESEEIWSKVDDLVKGGHDGVIKDLHWSHGEYVDKDLNMIFDGRPTVWLLLQLQNEPVSSIEFLLKEVEEIRLNPENELMLSAEIDDKAATLYLSELKQSYVKATALFYAIPEPSKLGNSGFNYW